LIYINKKSFSGPFTMRGEHLLPAGYNPSSDRILFTAIGEDAFSIAVRVAFRSRASDRVGNVAGKLWYYGANLYLKAN
jgi:hypothetical protein